MFHGLQCTMVNPFVAGSLILFTFVEIVETICETAFKELSSQMAAKILKHEKAENIFKMSCLIKLRFSMDQNADYFNNANQHLILFFIQSYLLYCCSTNALNLTFLIPSKIPTCTSQVNSLKICIYIPQRKPNLKLLS